MKIPNPMGCRWCGIDQRPHAIQTGPDGTHEWAAPAQQQIKDRMLARRAERKPMTDRMGELLGIAHYLQQRGVDLDDASLTAAANLLRRIVDEAQPTARERIKHSGPDTKFCVLCLSGEHERVDEDPMPDGSAVDNSAEAWEEDWNDSPQLGGMGEELRQEYGE